MKTVTKKSTSKILAENVRTLRLGKGWTQADLAARLKRQQQRVAEIENAKYPVSTKVIDSLATVFRISSADLITEPTEKKS